MEGVVTKVDRDVADETKLLVFLGSKRAEH
jgi:hypothetical protein